MPEFLSLLFDTSNFPRRWDCGEWTALHGWLHVVADVLVWGAYVAIPLVLGYFVIRKRNVPFPKIFWMFGLFIFACGTTHLIEASLFWWPWYRLAGSMKVLTAAVSWATVLALVPLTPRALAMRTPEELEQEIAERQRVEAALRQARDELEQRVRERTAELASANVALREKNAEMEQLLSIVSHDLKSPLVTTSGFVGLLKEDLRDGDAEGVQEAVLRIERSVVRMNELIDDLLDFSRLGRVRHEPEPVDPGPLVRELEEQLADRLRAAGATLEVQPDMPAVIADRRRLSQIFENLLTNAIKYGCAGAVRRITVGGERRAGNVRYFVRDEGPGVAPQYHARIFRLFERLDNRQEGTGVGLAIVARAAEQHGGHAWVDSDVGRGATFWIELPLDSEAASRHEGVDGADWPVPRGHAL